MSITRNQEPLHGLCNGWKELIKIAEEEISKTADRRRIKRLKKLARVSKQVLEGNWFGSQPH